MANSEYLDMLKQGMEAWNSWMEQETHPVDLREANLDGCDLAGFNL